MQNSLQESVLTCDDGIVMYTDANKFTARFNSEFNFLNGRIKVGENLTVAYRTGHGVANLDEGSPIQMASYRTQPIIPVIMTVAVPDRVYHMLLGRRATGVEQVLRQDWASQKTVVASLTRTRMTITGTCILSEVLFLISRSFRD